MSSTSPHTEIVSTVVTLLRNQITDPLTTRASEGRNFIYSRFPREDATFPRISVTPLTSGNVQQIDIETQSQMLVQPIQIDVWVGQETFEIDGTKYNWSALLDYMAGQVTNAISDNRYNLSENNIYDILLTRSFGDLSSGINGVQRILGEFEVLYLID